MKYLFTYITLITLSSNIFSQNDINRGSEIHSIQPEIKSISKANNSIIINSPPIINPPSQPKPIDGSNLHQVDRKLHMTNKSSFSPNLDIQESKREKSIKNINKE